MGIFFAAKLAHNLTVVFRHLEEVGYGHRALVAFFTAANRDNTIGNFLLSHNQEVRHLLQFALADFVAELLTPLASAAAPRSCQNSVAQAFCRDTRLARFPSRGRRSRPLRMLVLWAFPHIYVRSGYIARPPVRTCGTPARLLQPSLAPRVLSPRGHYP